MRIPSRGEIWHVNLNPTAGRGQQGARPVLVVSEKEFNRAGLVLVCPMTQGGNQARFAGFAVTVMNTGTKKSKSLSCATSRAPSIMAHVGRVSWRMCRTM
jgi:mRNA-degrading endonuclease toxin of MazEF toxin-antitoxin module